ncbi:insulinase family protein [Nitrospira defluvii]|nr:insulinase family protein [Nitrospira defluvii]
MNRHWVSMFLILSLVIFFPVTAQAEPIDKSDPRTMTFDPIVFQPPKAERLVLSNGMILYLLEDHELPLITLQAMIRTGDIYESADKIGLASITGSVMRSGGTRNRRGDEIDEMLDQIAARLSVGIGTTSGSASLDTLKKDFPMGLNLLADILMRPAFEEDKLTIVKNRALEGIRRRNDRPSSIANREFWKQLYGKDNPYARESTKETIGSISRSDLIAFHKKYFAPNNMIVGITGDFEKGAMIAKIEKVFSGWPKKEIDFPKVAKVIERKKGAIYKVIKAIPQTQVRMGHLGIKQKNPDFYALSIMNDILGAGGLNSRLFQDVRTRQGLAYSVGSVFRPGKLERGFFLAYAATRTETTHQTISTMIHHIEAIREDWVSDEELNRAKDAFLNSFIFSFSSPSQIVGRQMSLEYFDLPADYLEQYRKNVAKVSKEDILRVAKQYLHPDRLIIVAVGDEEKFDKPLSVLGKVEELSITP